MGDGLERWWEVAAVSDWVVPVYADTVCIV